MTQVRLYRDEQGHPGAAAEPPCEPLGWFLSQDIQDNQAWCQELFELIAQHRAGDGEEYREAGNAHVLELTAEGARIETLFEEPERICELSLDDFERALRDWCTFVAGFGDR